MKIIGQIENNKFVIDISNFSSISNLSPNQINYLFQDYEAFKKYNNQIDLLKISINDFLKKATIPEKVVEEIPDYLSLYYVLCLHFADKQYNIMQIIDKLYLNETIIKINIRKFGKSIKYIPKEFRHYEIYEFAIYHHTNIFIYDMIPKKYLTVNLCKIIYDTNPNFVKLFPLHIQLILNNNFIKEYDLLDKLVFG